MAINPTAQHTDFRDIVWRDPNGEPLACAEKIKVLSETLSELHALAQDSFEDALLMGADETQIRAVLAELIASVDNPYGEKLSK